MMCTTLEPNRSPCCYLAFAHSDRLGPTPKSRNQKTLRDARGRRWRTLSPDQPECWLDASFRGRLLLGPANRREDCASVLASKLYLRCTTEFRDSYLVIGFQ